MQSCKSTALAAGSVHFCANVEIKGAVCRIVKLVRALRKGWIQTTEQRKVTREEPPAYLLWADDGVASDKIANGQQPNITSCQKLP